MYKSKNKINKNYTAKKTIWITWENQRRNREISGKVGVPLFELYYIDDINNRIVKYLKGLLKTTSILLVERPHIIFCQNPSIVLALYLCLLGKIFNLEIVVDAHNAGLFPFECQSRLLNEISILIQKLADLTIVSNNSLEDIVKKNGGKALAVPDPLPTFNNVSKVSLPHPFNVLYICSFSDDEPYDNVLKAGELLGDTIHLYITGNFKKKKVQFKNIPKNIELLGYISETEYLKMLHSVDATIDLTTRENCLVCGAYESIAAGKPMVISNTKALRQFFNKGAVFTDNTVQGIEGAVRKLQKEYNQLLTETEDAIIEIENKWQSSKSAIEKFLYRK